MRNPFKSFPFLVVLVALAVGATLHFVAAQTGPRKFALLIANVKYPASIGALQLPYKDVQRIREAMPKDVAVTVVSDRTIEQMEMDLQAFTKKVRAAGPNAIAFYYFAGHGAADGDGLDGKNYLIPVGQDFRTRLALKRQAMSVETVTKELRESGAKASIVVIDACRNLAFDRALGQLGGRGLAQQPQVRDMLIVYATSPGKTAEDSGTFGATLAEELQKPGDVLSMFKEVQRKVDERTKGGQTPEIRDQILARDVCLNACGSSRPKDTVTFYNPLVAEADFWVQCCTGVSENDPLGFKKYLDEVRKGRFSGTFRELAELRLNQIQTRLVATRAIVSDAPFDAGFRERKVDARQGDAPWNVALISTSTNSTSGELSSRLSCGGVMISSTWMLTAANCLDDERRRVRKLYAVPGAYNISSNTTSQIRAVVETVLHPSYRAEQAGSAPVDNIALARIDRPWTGPTITLSGSVATDPVAGTMGAFGFGKFEDDTIPTHFRLPLLSPIIGDLSAFTLNLKGAYMPLVPQGDCAKQWSSLNHRISPAELCAGYFAGVVDTCTGDSGGPLVAWSNGRPYVIGITSFGKPQCFEKGPPGVYARVSSYANWIRSVVGEGLKFQPADANSFSDPGLKTAAGGR